MLYDWTDTENNGATCSSLNQRQRHADRQTHTHIHTNREGQEGFGRGKCKTLSIAFIPFYLTV